jgi:hypothetical protein
MGFPPDDFSIDRQTTRAVVLDRFVGLLGAYLGECILDNDSGEWRETEFGISIVIRLGRVEHIVKPFHRVHRRIVHGQRHNLAVYFATSLPNRLLGGKRLAPGCGVE